MSRFEQFNIIMDSQLPAQEKLLLLAIFRTFNVQYGYSFPTIQQIMTLMNLKNQQYFYKYRNELQSKGILIVDSNWKNNRYTIDYDRLLTFDKCVNFGTVTNDKSAQLQNESTKIKHTYKTNNTNNNYIGKGVTIDKSFYDKMDKETFDYINGGWMEEMSSEWIC